MSLRSDPRSLAGRPTEKSKILGQVLTPQHIAGDMVREILIGRKDTPVSILDPAVGPGTFPRSIIEQNLTTESDEVVMFDVDGEMIELAKSVTKSAPFVRHFVCEDYLDTELDRKFDFAILNPPYIRQEWIEKKDHYRKIFREKYHLKVPGTSNIYVYFIAKVLYELKAGGGFVCIIYDSWQFTKYGAWIESLINANCEQVRIVPVKDQPFENRLIDATIIYGRRTEMEFTPTVCIKPRNGYQSSLSASYPISDSTDGFKPIEILFETKRGLRLKQANFFLCDAKPRGSLGETPFVKKLSHTNGYLVPENHKEAILLISEGREAPLAYNEIMRRLALAQTQPEQNLSILTWYKERPSTWYMHREPPYAPLIFNYYIRSRPKHIYNPQRAYADNFYGLVPKSDVSPLALLALMNSTCVCLEIRAHSRNQGNGLVKIQLYEYRSVRVPDWTKFSENTMKQLQNIGNKLLTRTSPATDLINETDELIALELGHKWLKPENIQESYNKIQNKE